MTNNRIKSVYNLSLPSFLKIIAAANFFLFIIYGLFLKENILELIVNKTDSADVKYYSAVFSYLDFSMLIVAAAAIGVVLGYKRIELLFEEFAKSKNMFLYVLAINAVLQLASIILIRTEPISDSFYYVKIADDFFKTGVYSNGAGNFQSAYWPVGLPAMIVLIKHIFGDSLFYMNLLNIFFSSVLLFAVYKIFGEELSRKAVAFLLLVFVLFPTNILSANVILTELPFSATLWFAVYFAVKKKISLNNVVAAGVLLGVAAYFRSAALPVGALLIFYFAKKFGAKRGIRYGAIVILIQFMILSPWIYRNYKTFNSFIPVSTNAGFNFLMGNCVNSKGKNDFSAEYDFFNQDEIGEQKNAFKRAFTDIYENPLESLLREPMKIFYSYYRGDYSVTWALKKTKTYIHPLIKSLFFYISNLWFYSALLFSLIYFLKSKKIFFDKEKNLFLILLFSYFILIILIFVGSERYIVSLYPIHFFLFVKYFFGKKESNEKLSF